jgi:membrane protease YdiL (CAAX protease family)
MIKNEKLKWLNILLWLASVASMIGLMILGSRVLEEDNLGLFIEFVIITIVTLLYLYLISGKKTFTFLNNQTGYTVKMLLPTLIFSAVFGFFGLLEAVIEKPPFMPDWQFNLVLAAANMFLVGIYEEGCFRACACDALLPVFRKMKVKHPFFLTALISGLLFGYVHVVSVDFSNLQQTLQFIFKIANLTLAGTAFMILYWKTRNLLGLAIVHGLNDFLPDFLNQIFIFKDVETTESYTSGEISTTVVYIIQFVVELICLIYIYRKVARTIDYEETLEEW